MVYFSYLFWHLSVHSCGQSSMKQRKDKVEKNFWYFVLNPILHGAGHFVPRLVDYLTWRLNGRSDWAHISWLFFFQHSLCPIEAIFQKKILKIWKIEKMFFDRSDIKGSPLWKKIFENYFFPIFCNKSYFFNLNLNSTCF